jgi:Skp family chaperone for outer membrane proteins
MDSVIDLTEDSNKRKRDDEDDLNMNNNNNNNKLFPIFNKKPNTSNRVNAVVNEESILYIKYLKEDKDRMFIIGVDIGEIYFIVSIYDIILQSMIDCYKLELRKQREIKSIDEMKIKLNQFYQSHGRLWQNVSSCFIEKQFDKQVNIKLENHFKTLIKPIKSYNINIRSVRKHYKQQLKKDIEKGMSKYNKRKIYKQNAVDFGYTFISEDCKQKISTDKRKHDYMEGGIFAKYGYESKQKNINI